MRSTFSLLRSRFLLGLFGVGALLLIQACGSGNNGTPGPSPTPMAGNGALNMMLSDGGTPDWATIGVKVLNVSLLPQGGGAAVSVFTAPTPAPVVNLAQLDSVEELLGKLQVPAGTYTGAVLTLSGNSGDVNLVVAAEPSVGFPLAGGTVVPAANIQIQGTTGAAPNMTVPVNLKFDAPVTVTANQTTALNVEVDLSHPAFIVGHATAAGVIWAVNFNNGPCHHRSIDDITKLILRHIYGSVTAVAADNTSITINKVMPTEPAVTNETAVDTKQSLTILADATNGTLFYDLDAKTNTKIFNFSAQAAGLVGRFVRVAARYQQDGTLVAVRVWASATFAKVFLDPEGYVFHVDKVNNVIAVATEDGKFLNLSVNANTQFFFRQPAAATKDAMPIGTGTAFLANLYRGFKVHVGVVDPLANPIVAQEVDIEIARFDGVISAASTTGFTDTRKFGTATDNYSLTLNYINSATPNGKDGQGNAVTGFKWWIFAFPSAPTTGPNAVAAFVAAVGGSANMGGTIGSPAVWGESYAIWGDPANPTGWSVAWTVIVPTPIPLGTVTSNWTTTGCAAGAGGCFGMTALGGTKTVTVNVSTTAGAATLVFKVDRANGIITLTPLDVTNTADLTTVSNTLVQGSIVKVFGVPQTDGSIRAYLVAYFTGTMPTS